MNISHLKNLESKDQNEIAFEKFQQFTKKIVSLLKAEIGR
jgi:hypothetical protein